MKPPPRNRTKPDRTVIPDPLTSRGHLSGQWPRGEQRILLKALKTHSRYTRGGLDDLDYNYLRKHLPTRSITEITSVVDYLKDKVISLANYKLRKKRWEQKKARKPIEVWRHMASVMAGTLEEPITAAFSQMLIVSSTEPRTLRNCDPPQVYRPPTDKDRLVGRTVPFRPMPRLPVKVEGPGANTARPVVVLKTPGPTMGPAKRLSAPLQVVRVPNSKIIPPPQKQVSTTAGTLPATTTTSTSQSAASSCRPVATKTPNAPASSPQPASQTGPPVTGRVVPSSGSAAVVKTESVGGSLIQTTQQPSEKPPTTTTTTTSTSKSTSSGPHTSSSSSSASAAGKTPVPSTAPSSGASSLGRPTPPPSTPAAAFHAKFGRTGKYATKDSPRLFGVKSVVDFERIYRYLSVINQPNEECRLTPMESAIVLDLLMSLPEELPLLDCNKLHKHLIKMHKFLSSTADSSKTAGEMFKELKDGLCDPTPSGRDGNRTNGQQQNAAAGGGGKKPPPDAAERQSSGSGNASGQPGDEMGLCPPLNPFMVPLKLLMRK